MRTYCFPPPHYEFDDLVWNYFHLLLGFQAKAAEPMGESLPNQEIFRRLAEAMGIKDPLMCESDAEVIDRVVADLTPPMSTNELKDKGWIEISPKPRTQFEDLVFQTPSGKIEVASAKASKAGHPRCPLPHFDSGNYEDTFRLLTPAGKWTLNTIFRDDPAIAKVNHPHSVMVHIRDAEQLGVSSGDVLKLWNSAGELNLEVIVSDVTIPGVLLSHKSARSCSDAEIGINVLNPGDKTDIGESSSVHGVRVMARRCS